MSALPHAAVTAATVAAVRDEDIIIAALGTNVFELFGAGDRQLNYYTWGGMGLAGSIGLGLALGRPERRVIVLDGDGALLMNPNAMFAIGRARPANLLHLVCDNRAYSTTGGQRTGSETLDLTELAGAYHYHWAERAETIDDVTRRVSRFVSRVEDGPGLLHIVVEVSSRHVKPEPDPLRYKYRFLSALGSRP